MHPRARLAYLSRAATFFLEFWKRKTIQLAYRWDVLGEEEEAERPRPQYCIKATGEAPNPITGRTEPYFPPSSRTPRFLTGWSIIAVMVRNEERIEGESLASIVFVFFFCSLFCS